MKFIESLRKSFARVCQKIGANDNNPFQFTPTEKQKARALQPPADNTVEGLHGYKVSDPFRPLEKLEAPETAAWLARENKKFDDFVGPASNVEAETIAFLEKAVPQGMREKMPGRYGDKYIVWRKEKDAERWSLYLKDVPDYGAPARLLLDPMQIDPSGKTDVVGTNMTDDGKMLAYALSVSGSDQTTLRFMDIETGKDIDLVYTNFRSSVNWDRDGQGFHYNHNDAATKSSEVRYHKMGTPVEEDKIIFTPNAAETRAGYFRLLKDSKDELGSYEWISVGNTQPNKNALLARPIGSSEAFREIFPHKEGILSPIHEISGKIYATTSLGAPNEKLVCFDINDPAPEKWQTILPEDKNDQMTSVFIWQNRIFATYSHDTGEVLKVFDLAGKFIHDVPLPPLSTFSMGNWRMEDKTCLMTYSNFQESGNIYQYDADANTLTLHKKSAVPIDLKDCIVERVRATSKDGTKVPMTVIRHPDTQLDGTAATLLYGYGGFNVSLEPGLYSGAAQWVRAGGIYVQANLRGGGEYGQAWYDAGRKENKQNVFDDFIACSEHLIKNSYTSNKRLAIQGGSNGGLLTLATVLQRPDLFGAVISEVPVADMFRFHIGSYYGYSWKCDYGDPDIKKDFNVAAKYSPLHNVKKGFRHPPILIKTDAHDDRVLPWHSFKMAATLQGKEDADSITLLKVKTDGGHGAGMTVTQSRQDVADVRAFLDRTLGPTDQQAYKKQLAAKNDQKLIKRVMKKFKRG
jgi:prolyl oligopeptidase